MSAVSLLADLRQRKLVQWALAYAAAAFALVQGVDLVASKFGWPNSFTRYLILAAVVGFFVTVVLAWYHGERGAQNVSRVELALLAAVLAIGAGVVWRFGPVDAAPAAASASRPASAPGAVDRKSIAVLPFENLSGDQDNAYFVSGMQDMILTKLAAIGELKVISRTSTEKYASRPGDLQAIAQQLGVATVLEGSVQKSGNSVLINVQLIDVASDRHLWAEAYPRTLDNIFGVEGEVAQKIADALRAKLTTAESASVASVPTQNAAAYESFLRAEYLAEQARQTWQPEVFQTASAAYRRAIELDPDFALADARLALCLLSQHWFFKSMTDAELAAVKATIDRALALSPELADAHLALAFYHYWGFRRYDAATTEFERTLQLSPNRFEAHTGLAYIERRVGRVAESLPDFARALALSPRDARLVGEIGWTHTMLRDYAEAERQLRRSLAIAPKDANIIDALVKARLFGFGDAAIADELRLDPPDWRLVGSTNIGGDLFHLVNTRAYPHFFARRFAQALKEWESAPVASVEERRSGRVARVAIRLVAGERDAVRSECEALGPELRKALRASPDALDLLQQTSWIEACLGRRAEALAAAQHAVDVLPLGKDSYFGAYQLVGLAQIAAQTGANEQALTIIRQLLALPAGQAMSTTRLRLDPVWDALRKEPEFEALLGRKQ